MNDPKPASADQAPEREFDRLAPFGELALDCLHREYPYVLIQVLGRPEDLALPRDSTPAFCGSFDWHSSVHTHWALVRLLREGPPADFAARAVEGLGRSLTADKLATEFSFVEARPGFERPYGLAWLWTLYAECRESAVVEASAWADRLEPLAKLARERLIAWFENSSYPVRAGEHSQTAFAMGLVLDAATRLGDEEAVVRTAARALEFYSGDQNAPLAYEPSGHDFLSPAAAEADVMARVLPSPEYSTWLDRFWPSLGEGRVELEPVRVPDRSDGKFAHLDGLHLSRAWMLRGMARPLSSSDLRRSVLEEAASRHAAEGLAATDGRYYAGGHWLGSFAVYLLTDRRTLPD